MKSPIDPADKIRERDGYLWFPSVHHGRDVGDACFKLAEIHGVTWSIEADLASLVIQMPMGKAWITVRRGVADVIIPKMQKLGANNAPKGPAVETVESLRKRGNYILSDLDKDPSKPIDWDVSVADLQRIVGILRATWVGSDEGREGHPRIGTIFVDPDRRSLRLELRVPLDFELLVGLMDKGVALPLQSQKNTDS